MYKTNFYQQLEYVQQRGNNLFEHEKVFQIIGIVLQTEQSIKSVAFIFLGFCLNLKSTFTIFKEFMTFRETLGKHIMMAVSAKMFYIAMTIRINLMKVAATNINIKIQQLFSKRQILGHWILDNCTVKSISRLETNLLLNNV